LKDFSSNWANSVNQKKIKPQRCNRSCRRKKLWKWNRHWPNRIKIIIISWCLRLYFCL